MESVNKNNICFVIMPIGELESYPPEHFRHVYEDLLSPAIKESGLIPKRADDERASNLIQVDIIDAPMAICDLSSRNPNVLFELGIRQAFDLPVVLIQEEGTPRIFDISTINTVNYRNSLIYREVLEDRQKISEAIKATRDNRRGINSIIKFLEIGKANIEVGSKVSEEEEIKILLYSISNRLNEITFEKEGRIDEVMRNRCKKIEEKIHNLKNRIQSCIDNQVEIDKDMCREEIQECLEKLKRIGNYSLPEYAASVNLIGQCYVLLGSETGK